MFIGRFVDARINKKSRIYGTSDRSDLSIYLSALLKLASNVQIGLKCTESASNVRNWPQMYGIGLKCTAVYLSISFAKIGTFEANLYI